MSSILESEEVQIEQSEEQVKLPASLPVLPLRDIVIFPYMIVPLFVQRERSIRAVDQALAENRMIMLVAQRDLEKEEPTGTDLYNYGTAAAIMRMRRALEEYIVEGIKTNIAFHKKLLVYEPFVQGRYDTRLVEKLLADNPN